MRNIVILGLFIMLPVAMTGQSAKVGMLFGVNLADWSGDDLLFAEDLAELMNQGFSTTDFEFTSQSRVGFTAGFLIDFTPVKFLSIQPEITYSQKGNKFSGTGTALYEGDYYSMEEDIMMQTDYVDFALLARILLLKSNIRPYIIGGPGVGYLVYSKMRIVVTVEGDADSETVDAEIFRKWDYHVNVGGGFDFSGSARLEFRYYHFFNPATEESDNEYKVFNNIKSISLIFTY